MKALNGEWRRCVGRWFWLRRLPVSQRRPATAMEALMVSGEAVEGAAVGGWKLVERAGLAADVIWV